MPSIYGQTTMEDVVLTICAILVIVIIVAAFVSFVYAVYFFLFSQGKEDKKAKGRNAIRYMIIWVVLTVLFLGILPFALKGVGVELKNYSTQSIFTRVGDVIKATFKVGTAIKDSQVNNQYRGDPYINTDTTKSSGYQL